MNKDLLATLISYVRDFHNVCDLSIGNPTDKTLKLWDNLIYEEFYEADDELFRYGEFSEKISLEKSNIPAYVAELCDELYVIFGQFVNLGVEKQACALLAAIHEANMNKADPKTGKVKKNRAGKVQKPKGWQKVDVEKVFNDASS